MWTFQLIGLEHDVGTLGSHHSVVKLYDLEWKEKKGQIGPIVKQILPLMFWHLYNKGDCVCVCVWVCVRACSL